MIFLSIFLDLDLTLGTHHDMIPKIKSGIIIGMQLCLVLFLLFFDQI